jgi:hypothetical protein
MKIIRGGFTSIHEADGLKLDKIYSIFEDRGHRPCTLSGSLNTLFLNCYDGHRFSSVHPNTPANIKYFGWGTHQLTFQDHIGEWWVATGMGLVRFSKVDRVEGLEHARPKAIYTKSSGLAGNDIFRLYEDSRGDLWISTIDSGGGLARWDRTSDRFQKYSVPVGHSRNVAATAFCEDEARNLWVGFYSGALGRFRDGAFTFLTEAEGAPGRMIESMYLDHAHRLWMAGYAGLVRIDNPTASRPAFVHYTTADGLASNHMMALIEDRWGRIYAGSGRGVDCFDPDMPPRPGHVTHYTVVDGLASNLVQVAFRDRTGALWFGAQHGGLSRLVPELPQHRPAPTVMITMLRVARREQALPEFGEAALEGLRLGSQENHLEIEYGSISFSPGEVLQYQYTLEGADTGWSTPSNHRSVNYANLASGNYRFLVRAIRADGIASVVPASISFTIVQPIPFRWWFVTSAILAVIGIGLAAHRLHINRFLELERVRS